MDPLSNAEISRLLGQAAIYGDNSFRGDFRNARAALGELNRLHDVNNGGYDFADAGAYDRISSGLKSQMGTAIAGSVISGLTGATQIANNAMQASQIQDTTGYENSMLDYVDRSNYNFVNYDQLANDMSQNYLSAVPTYDDIRGMNGWQKAGNIGSSMLSGAQAGMQIGGPWGAAIGAGIGAIGGVAGVLSGDAKAERKQMNLQAQNGYAQYAANANYQAAHERIGNYNFRSGVANAAKAGGQIDRKKAISSFTDSKLRSAKAKEHTPSNVTRIQKDGGTVYRVRVK